MKAAIIVPGRFHLFYLAEQLLKRGVLSQLITSYPKFEVVKYGIPRDKVSSIVVKELMQRSYEFLPPFIGRVWNPQYFIHELFDRGARAKLKPADIVIGGSSVFLRTLEKAREFGAITILERGSSHMEYQQRILREEYERFGMKGSLAHPKVVERELLEYEKVDYISIPSFFVKRTFLEAGIPERKLIHVPYGVDLSSFHPIPKADKAFRVMFVGGMTLRKGVHYLLQAWNELDLPNAELLLIGSMNNEMKPFFKKYGGKFKWIGHVPQEELYKYYSQSSVFALPSIEEGLAMVQLQAMACGLPVIATTNTGAEDIVRDGTDGFIIPIRNVGVLKEKILYLYEHPEERERMGRSAKERVASGFTWDDYGERIVGEYQRILKQ